MGLGLNKHVQKKFGKVDAIDNVSKTSLDDQ